MMLLAVPGAREGFARIIGMRGHGDRSKPRIHWFSPMASEGTNAAVRYPYKKLND